LEKAIQECRWHFKSHYNNNQVTIPGKPR